MQALAGIAAARGDEGLYFSLGGYTTEALAFAEEAGVAAFSFDLQGKPAALTSAAARLVTRGEAVPREPAHASDTSAEAVLGDRRLRGESRDFTCDECGTVNPDIYAGQLTDLACECNADLGDYGSLITSCDLCQRFVPEALTRWNGTTVCQHCVTRLEMRDCDVCGRPREMSDLIRFSSESGLVEVVACDVESDDRGPCASQFRAIEEALWRAASARKLAEPEHWRLRS